jgi:hypothetical protein
MNLMAVAPCCSVRLDLVPVKVNVKFLHDIILTQRKLVALGKRYVTAGPEWTETRIDTTEEIQRTVDYLSSGKFDIMTMIAQIKAGLLSWKYKSAYKETGNELLQPEKLSEEDFVELGLISQSIIETLH